MDIKRLLPFILLVLSTNTTVAENDMVLVKGGEVQLRREKPNKVLVKDFYMDKCEVTIAQFEAFVKATGYLSDSENAGYSMCIRDTVRKATWKCSSNGKVRPRSEYNKPVIHVSYNDAAAYAKWAKKRLPTEAEWMIAASDIPPGKRTDYVWYEDNARINEKLDVQAVGSKSPNRRGIYDLLGNAQEWTSSLEDDTDEGFGSGHISKGGCFWDFKEDFMGKKPTWWWRRMVTRKNSHTSERVGFRCAKDKE